MAEEARPTGDREFWKGVLDENLEEVKNGLMDAIHATKEGMYGVCDCGRRVKVKVPDVRAVNDAVKTLHALAGNPVTARQDAGQGTGGGVNLTRILIAPDGAKFLLPETGLDPVARLPDDAA